MRHESTQMIFALLATFCMAACGDGNKAGDDDTDTQDTVIDVIEDGTGDVPEDTGGDVTSDSIEDTTEDSTTADTTGDISSDVTEEECIPTGTEVDCNGTDDDCDDLIDEDYIVDDTCGVGYCRDNNTPSSCSGGTETPCAPGVELAIVDTTCDDVDDDCSGEADEDYIVVTTCGDGYCEDTSTPSSCTGGTETACAPGTPLSASDGTCDGVDDDCSGTVDEDYAIVATCGVGYCEDTSTPSSCTGGTETACVPGTPLSSSDGTCDGEDDDCSGTVDEDYAIVATCGVGYCEDTSTPSICSGGVETSCIPGTPLSSDDATCDGVDDDCSGTVDEDYVVIVACGLGHCWDTSTPSICSGGVETSCIPGTPTSSSETACDGVDENCNGIVDDPCPAFFEQTGMTTPLGAHGDAVTGNPFLHDCPPNEVVRGIYGEVNLGGGQELVQIGLVCGELLPEDAPAFTPPYSVIVNSEHDLPIHGGAGGTPFRSICPTNYVMTGIEGESNGNVYQVAIHCSSTSITGSVGSYSLGLGAPVARPQIGLGTGTHFGPDFCPAGEAVTGIYGRNGAYINEIGFRCREITLRVLGDPASGYGSEICNDVDDNADGTVDESCPETIYRTGTYYETAYGAFGGSPYELLCEPDEVLHGLRVRRMSAYPNELTYITGICSQIEVVHLSGPPWDYGVEQTTNRVMAFGAGSGTTSNFTMSCLDDQFVVGLEGYADPFFYRLEVRCAPIGIMLGFGQNYPTHGSVSYVRTVGTTTAGGTHFGPDDVSSSRVGVGVHGMSNGYVYEIGLVSSRLMLTMID